MVGVQGFEPWTPCSQSRCATRLRYTPTESIFYTESSITGKSCNIRAMVAYFSCKFKKQVKAALSVALLFICLLGTHWLGLSHSISHAAAQNQSIEVSAYSNVDSSLNHSSDVCHLLDALSLAGFIPSAHPISAVTFFGATELNDASKPSLRNVAGSSYQSRAPPTFIL